MPRLSPGTITLFAGRIFQALITLAAFRCLTSFVAPAEAGGVYLMASFGALFCMFLVNPVWMYITRHLFIWQGQKTVFPHFLGYNLYVLAVSVLSFPVVFIAWSFFTVGGDLPGYKFAFLVACYVYVLSWSQGFIPALNIFGHKLSFVFLTAASAGASLLFSLLFVLFLHPGATQWFLGQILGLGLVTAISAAIFRSLNPEPTVPFSCASRYFNRKTIATVSAFTVPLAAASFFMWAQAQSYRLIVESVNGAELLGYMAVGFSLATSVAGILESLVQQVCLPDFYRKISAGNPESRRQALAELSAKTIPVYLIYLFFMLGAAEYLEYFLVSPKYSGVFVYARYGAFIEFLRMSTNILASAAHSEMRTKILIKPYLLGGLCAMVTVFFAARSWAPNTLVPLALLVSGAVTLLFMRRAISPLIKFDLSSAFLVKPILFSLLFVPFAFVSPWGGLQAFSFLAVLGIYFCLLQFWVARRWIGVGKEGPTAVIPAVDMENMSSPGNV